MVSLTPCYSELCFIPSMHFDLGGGGIVGRHYSLDTAPNFIVFIVFLYIVLHTCRTQFILQKVPVRCTVRLNAVRGF